MRNVRETMDTRTGTRSRVEMAAEVTHLSRDGAITRKVIPGPSLPPLFGPWYAG
jgi:hypothetical protein